ncbi:hypothetical protein SYNPS1DRAFT_28682 [Syncephalis pseudoplumigaleata]|uniref:G-protein coupled receptors family 1 profile domain-containing protein n=1 Tax=Syncephalis pseudoplumigaleata TaxID=1712513 RepID=A0A4P9Z029_9FUNG|nr:hypothetical protein SYNPS1DRAFT_28682 [Syncephalis pseudoplumigaleata]|eukprot:RKP25585.1 hypothetical protein SYNPS1DRAFT_28682 [Syncephalis pseudoplumigaleata]
MTALTWAQIEYRESSLRVLSSMLMLLLSIRNTMNAAKLLYAIRRPIFMLNLVQSAVAIVALCFSVAHQLWPRDISCFFVGNINVTVITIGVPAISTILLVEAYHSTNQSMWIRMAGIGFVSCYVAIGIAGYFSMDMLAFGITQCDFRVTNLWIIQRCALDFCFNAMLVYCFGTVITKECRTFNRSLRCTIVRDGLIYAVCVVFSNLLCALCILLSREAHHWEMHIYGADYCVASTLICVHLQSARKRYTRRVEEMRVIGALTPRAP